jgi:putative transposase
MKTLERWKENPLDQRNGPISAPANKLTAEERKKVIAYATSSEFMNKTPWEIVPSLADKGIYIACEATFYRILKQEKMLAHRGRSAPRTHTPPPPLVAIKPNQVWSWDITYINSAVKGKYYFLYMIMDIYSRKITGWNIHESESMEFSSQLIDETCFNEKISQNQLTLHSDNGGPMKGATMLATLRDLGVAYTFSRAYVSDDNAYSESLFKTLKYCPLYPMKPFENIEAAKSWVSNFVNWFNNIHLHSGIKFVTPNDRHNGKDEEILKARAIVYEEAKKNQPNRWSKETRNWDLIKEVKLNPLRSKENRDKKEAA